MVTLNPREWRRALDLYLATGEMTSEDYEQMTPEQVMVIQELKKAKKRQVKSLQVK